MITLDPPRPCTSHPAGTRAGAEFRKSLRRPRCRETGQAMGPLRSAFDHKRYADPYTDVTLDVRHLQTARWQQRPLWGFYDGRQTRRICFMPDQIGIWRYHA